MERIAVVKGLTLAGVLARVEAGGRLVLTRDGVEVALIVRPADVGDAMTEYLLEGLDSPNLSDLVEGWEPMDLSTLLEGWDPDSLERLEPVDLSDLPPQTATNHFSTDDRPPSPPEVVS